MVASEKKKASHSALDAESRVQPMEVDSGSSSRLTAELDRNDRHSRMYITTAIGGGFLLRTKRKAFTPLRLPYVSFPGAPTRVNAKKHTNGSNLDETDLTFDADFPIFLVNQ